MKCLKSKKAQQGSEQAPFALIVVLIVKLLLISVFFGIVFYIIKTLAKT